MYGVPQIFRLITVLQMPRNSFVSKIMCDKLPVADRLNFFDSSESAICQNCNTHVETQQHFFQCKETLCRKHRLQSWIAQTRIILRKGHTSRIMMDTIDSNLRNYLKLPDHPSKWQVHQGNRSVFVAVQRAIADQTHIGWHKFLQGLLHNVYTRK